MYKKIQSLIWSYKATPLLLFLICVISYGILTPLIGLFLDDWYLLWFKHTFGASELINYFQADRPLEGYFYIIANFLLGNSERPIVWQIFGVFTRWLSTIALWQMLNTIWPRAVRLNSYVSLLVSVFPGFSQQWIAASYSFHFVCLAGFFYSITLMVKAIRSPKNFWMYYILSLVIMAYVIPASEFFIGLEFIRVVILYFEVKENFSKLTKSIVATARLWLPYSVVLIGFVIWRTFYYKSAYHSLSFEEMLSDGWINFFISSIRQAYQAIIDAVVNSWSTVFNLTHYPKIGLMSFVIPLVMLIVFIVLLIWLRNIHQKDNFPIDDIARWRVQAPWLALTSLVTAIIPFWAAGLPIDYHYPYDRFLLAYMFGSGLLLVWLFEGGQINYSKTAVILSLLVAISAGYQFSLANQFKNMWTVQRDFYWQLIWRAPEIEPGTTILTYQFPNNEYWSGNSLTAFLNWSYSENVGDKNVDYQFIILNSGQKQLIPTLEPGQRIVENFRSYSFEGNTSQVIFVHFSTDGCLRVLDDDLNNPRFVLDYVAEQKLIDDRVDNTIAGARLTNLELISASDASGNYPSSIVIGKELPHTWCFYYEKAELEHQLGDYQAIVALYSEAESLGLSALDPTEYYPFIDSFARSGQWQKAQDLTLALIPAERVALHDGICQVWSGLHADFPDELTPEKLLVEMHCSK